MNFGKILVLALIVTPCFAEDLYIGQSAAGSGNGSNCANQLAFSFFNSSGNWGAGVGKISPGDTVHICGTITGGANSTLLTFQGDGTSGQPVTLLFEASAILTNTNWGNNGAIYGGGTRNWIIVDGGTNGLIQNTANGSSPSFPNQTDSTGIYFPTCNNCILRNMTVANMYVRNNSADVAGGGSTGIQIGAGQANRMYSNVVHDVELGIDHDINGTQAGIEIDHNTVFRCNHSIAGASTGTATVTNWFIHDNEIYDWVNWDEPATNHFHHNGVFLFCTANSCTASPFIYNNYLHGSVGNFMTAMVFLDITIGTMNAKIFNNIFSNDNASFGATNGLLAMGPNVSSPLVANNTFNYSSNNSALCVATTATAVSFQNNIFRNCGEIYFVNGGAISASDFNDFFGFTTFDGSATTLAAWRISSGFDANSSSGDPKLNSDFTLQAGSAAIGLGTNLTSLGIAVLNIDKAGNARPSSGPWDSGPYQFVTGPSVSSFSGTWKGTFK